MALDFKNKEKVAEVKLSDKNFIFVSLVPDTNGNSQLDVRKHFLKDDGEIQHTTKGLTLEPGIWTQVIEAIKQAQEKAAKTG